MKYKRMTQDDIQEIYRLHVVEGWTDRRLAEHYGRTIYAIRSFRIYHGISRLNLPARAKKKLTCYRWTRQSLEELRKMYIDERLTDKQIAAKLGMTRIQVRAARVFADIIRPPKMTYDAMRQRARYREKARRLFKLKLQQENERKAEISQRAS